MSHFHVFLFILLILHSISSLNVNEHEIRIVPLDIQRRRGDQTDGYPTNNNLQNNNHRHNLQRSNHNLQRSNNNHNLHSSNNLRSNHHTTYRTNADAGAFKVTFPNSPNHPTISHLLVRLLPHVRQELQQHPDIPSFRVQTPKIPVIGVCDVDIDHNIIADISTLNDRSMIIDRSDWSDTLNIRIGGGSDPSLMLNLEGQFHSRQRRFPHTKDDGTWICAIGIDIDLGIAIQPNSSFHSQLQVSIPHFEVSITSFDLKLHGKAPKFISEIFVSLVKPIIEGDVKDVLRSLMPEIISSLLQQEIDTYEFRFPFGNPDWNLSVDFALKNFLVTHQEADFLSIFAAAGEFLSTQEPIDPYPFEPQYVPNLLYVNDDESQLKMIQLLLDEFVLNTLGYTAFKKGILHRTQFLDGITTDNLTLVAPALGQMFPEPRNIQVDAFATDRATAEVLDNSVIVRVPARFVYQVLNDSNIFDAFSIDSKLVINLNQISITENALLITSRVALDGQSCEYSLASSNVGEVNVELLAFFMGILMDRIVNEQIDPYAQKGVNLPRIPKLTIYDASLRQRKGYFIVDANVEVP